MFSLEHLEMLILEVHPFLVDPPPPWGKLKMPKVACLQVTLPIERSLLVHEPRGQRGEVCILYSFDIPRLSFFFVFF